ncbi:NADH-quinone oxidoreductase subunit J [Acidipropionibacterium jensenii]|uniref:NADH-quinone oxidoreductase subunit J n=1 Tax=Acidipropionibacterium jensenii TaxID=1749 RepID=UPI000BC3242F|nr:NADH-quinone oxidoreductase subunit J [Acidipropionibacterium jensenii]AZZ42786.1 NADH-quinone oxidoreductase subunit J [Acidipropionibacterium jensenii]
MIAMVTAAQWAFWLLAPIMVIAALAMVLTRKAVHSALCLAVVMICMAVQYASLQAPFLFVVQIIVYTGAILMLFVFVVMMIGRNSRDVVSDTMRHHRVASVITAVILAAMLVVAVGSAVTRGQLGITGAAGLTSTNAEHGTNVISLAALLFSRYVIPFEATAALLITGVVGTMVLAHGELLHRKKHQRERFEDRMKAYATDGVHPGAQPNSGVYARNNQIGAPALLPDGSVAPESVSQALRSRGGIVDAGQLRAPTERAFATITAARAQADGTLPEGELE